MPQYVSLNITRVWEGFRSDPGIARLQWASLPGDLSARLANNEYVSVIGMVHKTLQAAFVGTSGSVDLEGCDADPGVAGNWYLIGTLGGNGALTDSAPRKFVRVSVTDAGDAGVNVSLVGSN